MHREDLHLPEEGRWPSILTLSIGLGYLVVGIIQILTSFGIISPIPGFTDPIGGFLLIIVASVFLTGFRPLSENNQEGYAFVAVGYILAAVMFALQVLVILSNALGWILQFQDWLAWNIINDITPSFWMFLIMMAGTGSLWIIGSMREKILGKHQGGVEQ
ncbi:MAG: hypothetical protein ACFFF9_12395 [Candidatus Thorarchaeota archaeon]